MFWSTGGQRRERLTGLYYSGTIDATRANLAFQVSGRVREVFVDEGHVVEKGLLLAVLEPAEFKARWTAEKDRI